MPGKAVSVDPGSHQWKVLACKDGKGGLALTRFGAVDAAEGARGLASLGVPLGGAVLGLSGRDMTLRYTQVPPSPDWQLRNLMELEIQDLASQSGGSLSADYNLLPVTGEEVEMDTILLALARDEALDRVADVVRDAQGSVSGHVPNCVALYNAYLRTAQVEDTDEVVCLANLGNETIDVALLRGHELLFARNLTGGCKVLDDAISKAFNVSARKADQLKRDLLDLDPDSRGRYASGQAEKVTVAAGGAASMFVSAIQSSVMFCQSQTKVEGLRLDRVLISGGGANLRGVRGMLREALRCPVERFDPFEAVDLSQLPAEDAEQLAALRSEAAVALGLAITRLDDSVYSLEILPESVKKRQRFLQRTAWNVAAGAIGVALLGFGAVQAKEQLASAEQAERRVSSDRRRIERTHEDADELIAQNRVDQAIADALAARALPLHGLLRTMRAVRDTVPPELWISSIEVGMAGGRERNAQRKQVIKVKGAVRAIGGADVGAVYEEFNTAFRQHPLIPANGVVAETDTGRADETEFTLTIDFLPEGA